jgi:hypothetical protein
MSEDRTRAPGRGISERQAESNSRWAQRYLANNSYAIDPSAFPDADEAQEQHEAEVSADLPHGPDGDENLFRGERRARIGETQNTGAGVARPSSALRREAPRPFDGPRDTNRTGAVPEGYHVGRRVVPEAEIAYERRPLPYEDIATNLSGRTAEIEIIRHTEAGGERSSSVLRRVAQNPSRPRRAPEASGAPLRRVTITNDTDSGGERNRQRANHVKLQKYLDVLGVEKFASPMDRMAWRGEWQRRSLAMAPKRLPTGHAAE